MTTKSNNPSPHRNLLSKFNVSIPKVTPVSHDDIPEVTLREIESFKPSGETITISSDAEGAIASAVERAPEGATILVPAGNYEECLNINKSIKFIAQGKAVINALGGSSTLQVTGGNVIFDGFSIKQKTSKARGAILLTGGSLTLDKCKVKSFAIATITCKEESSLELLDCTIQARSGIGISLNNSSQLKCTSTSFTSCKVSCSIFKGDTVGVYKNCVFIQRKQSATIATDQSSVSLDGCLFNECSVEMSSTSDRLVLQNSTFKMTQNGTCLTTVQNPTLYVFNNTFNNGNIDFRGNADIKSTSNRYFCCSMAVFDNCNLVSTNEKFENSAPGQEKGSAIGTQGTSQVNISNASFASLGGSALVCYQDSQVTIKDTNITSTGTQGLVCHSGGQLTIENITFNKTREDSILVQNGRLIARNVTVKYSSGNGISINDSSSTCELTDIKVINNSKCGIFASNADVAIESCEINQNSYAGLHSINSSVSLTKCSITKNSKGGITSSKGSRVKLQEGCTVTANSWAGLLCEEDSYLNATGCPISENQIGVNCIGQMSLNDCQITNHKEHAVQCLGSLSLDDSTISRNGIGLIAGKTGNVNGSDCKFETNGLHAEVTNNATISFTQTKFIDSTGKSAISITESGTGVFSQCEIVNSKDIAIYLNGKIDMNETKVLESGEIALLCDTNSSGRVNECIFSGKGSCGIQLAGGNCLISNNTIEKFQQFGIYIKPQSKAAVENNDFKMTKNQLANLWKE